VSTDAGDSSRLTAGDILDRVLEDARDEISRPAVALLLSGIVAGIIIGITPLSVALTKAELPPGGSSGLVSALFYPIGFIAVIIGRGQLFTENTVYPVALVLDSRRHLWPTARLWVVVLAGNLVGATAFAVLAVVADAVPDEARGEMVEMGRHAAHQPFGTIFWSAVVGGWLIALVAWLVAGSHWTVGQVLVIWLVALPVGLGSFAHSVAGSAEILAAALRGAASAADYGVWLAAALLGNIAGGVTVVSLLNYGQVRAKDPGGGFSA
jgi:formate-nitrite transporter family protein